MLDDVSDSGLKGYINSYQNRTLLRFITCGSVDDGKSTLIGRLLYDSNAVFEDQLAAIARDGKKVDGDVEKLDLSLLVDGLQSEREQGITIDVAYRYFSTDTRKFIIADTPGHEQYTRNMATGASTADLAIVLIDARKGVLAQTKRHSYIAALMGIKHIVIAINKMDLVGYDKDIYSEIKSQYESIIKQLPNFESISFYYVPICALNGDNVVVQSENMPWYDSTTMIELLNGIDIEQQDAATKKYFKMSVQYVNRPHLDFRGFCGLIVEGEVAVGQSISVLPSNKKSKVKGIISSDIKVLKTLGTGDNIESVNLAKCGESVTLLLEDEIDIGRGDMIVGDDVLMPISDCFDAMVVWMGEKEISDGEYIFKIASMSITGKIEKVYYKKEINTLQDIHNDGMGLNDIGRCRIRLSKAVPLDLYSTNRYMGGFIVIDKYTNDTVGAGMVADVADYEQRAVRFSSFELFLNKLIRYAYPHWEAKDISKAQNNAYRDA